MAERTKDYLYPNPAVRAKMISDKGIATIGVGSQYTYISTFDITRIEFKLSYY